MNLSLPLLPVYLVDFTGSGISLLVAVGCAVCSRRLSNRDRSNALWTYLFWISMAFAAFALSRSVGHMLKYVLTLSGHRTLWSALSPISGAINSMTFIIVATLTFYYERVKRSHHAYGTGSTAGCAGRDTAFEPAFA